MPTLERTAASAFRGSKPVDFGMHILACYRHIISHVDALSVLLLQKCLLPQQPGFPSCHSFTVAMQLALAQTPGLWA